MASHHEQQEPLVSGNHVYLYKNGQTIYRNPLTKLAYIITKDEARAYTFYSARSLLGVGSAYVLTVLLDNPFIGFAVGGSLWGVISLVFYLHFLPSLAVEKRFVPPKKISFLERMIRATSTARLISAGFFSLLIGFFIYTLAHLNNYQSYILYFNLLFVLGTILFAGFCFFAAFQRFKREKNGEFPTDKK